MSEELTTSKEEEQTVIDIDEISDNEPSLEEINRVPGKCKIYIGRSGSGKSYWMNCAIQQEDIEGQWYMIDNPSSLTQNDILEMLMEDKNIMIASDILCKKDQQEWIINALHSFEYDLTVYYFEDDKEKCKNNIRRKQGHTPKDLEKCDIPYFIPDDVTPCEIWQEQKLVNV